MAYIDPSPHTKALQRGQLPNACVEAACRYAEAVFELHQRELAAALDYVFLTGCFGIIKYHL